MSSTFIQSNFKGFETRKSTGMIFIDLQKAVDTLDRQILLKKLKYIGFSPETVRWFERVFCS